MSGSTKHRSAVLVTALALVVGACGGSGATSTTAAPSPGDPAAGATATTTTSASATTSDPGTTPPTTPAPVEDLGDPAPDFTLALAGGDATFTLSREVRPVYLVFWAEW